MATSALARKTRRELDKELESASVRVHRELEWSAAERAVVGLIEADFDRISYLRAAYTAAVEAGEVKVQIKLSAELRLLEQSAARLLKQIKTDLPEPESSTTRRARSAANSRWDRVRGAAG